MWKCGEMVMNRSRWWSIVAGSVGVLVLAGCGNPTGATDTRSFVSPYADLDWERIERYDAMFHTHPGLGDEQYDPHQTIDRYSEEGYRILSLAGHDYDVPLGYITSIYPWTRLAQIYEQIKDVKNPTEGGKTYGQIANEPYENRDPVALGMIAVEGCEVSAPHHIVTLFGDCVGGTASHPDTTESATLERVAASGALAYFAHPGRYVDRWGLDESWYVEKYIEFEALLGQAIFNRRDAHPGDQGFFDRVAHSLGPERPIWLFAEDDMHKESELAWNRNVFLLEDFEPGSFHPDSPDGSSPQLRTALRNGYFYVWKPNEQYVRRAFDIVDMKIDDQRIELVVDRPEAVDEIIWRMHVPLNARDWWQRPHRGNTVHVSDVPTDAVFVRAEISGPAGTIFTQPFYLR